jgi:hypothetical protein
MCAPWGFGQQPANANPEKPKTPAAPAKAAAPAAVPTLEEMLTRALKDNPDVRVAEAKVREAEAELNRTRLQVTQRVIALHHALEAEKAKVDNADKELKRLQALAQSKAVAPREMDLARFRLTQAKAKLAEVEAEMPYLFGKPPQAAATGKPLDYSFWMDLGQPVFPSQARPWQIRPSPFFPENPQRYRLNVNNSFDVNPDLTNWYFTFQPKATPPGSVADKIRKGLDTPVQIEFSGRRLADVLEALEQKVPGVSFRVLDMKDESKVSELRVNLRLKDPLRLGAALQALKD